MLFTHCVLAQVEELEAQLETQLGEMRLLQEQVRVNHSLRKRNCELDVSVRQARARAAAAVEEAAAARIAQQAAEEELRQSRYSVTQQRRGPLHMVAKVAMHAVLCAAVGATSAAVARRPVGVVGLTSLLGDRPKAAKGVALV